MINRIDRKEKMFIKMQKRLREISDLKSSIPWIRLKEPIQRGWTINIGLSPEALRRDDGEVMAQVVALCDKDFHLGQQHRAKISAIRKNPYLNKIRHLFMTNRPDGTSSYGGPHLASIPEKKWKEMDLPYTIRKFFSDVSTVTHQRWGAMTYTNTKYICNISDHYLVLKVTKRMLNYYQHIDPELEREEAYLDDMMKEYYRTAWHGGKSAYDKDKDPTNARKRWKAAITHAVKGDIENPEDYKKLRR